MDILNPPRLATLQPKTITVVFHTGTAVSNEKITNIFPMTTLLNLKQRIAITRAGQKQWLPQMMFLAEETPAGLRTIEFVWPFSQTLLNPLERPGEPDERIFGPEGRKPIFPKMLSNATVEQTIQSDTIHVWSFVDIASALGGVPRDEVFQGYFQLYWPAINTAELADAALSPITVKEEEIFTTSAKYIAFQDERFSKIESLLSSDNGAKPASLRELRRYRAILPQKEPFLNGGLELLFYTLQTSEHLPFLRFFPQSERVAPLVKVHSNKAGKLLLDEEILDALLADNPIITNSALLLLKAPIRHPRAPVGAAWSLLIHEDGSAELSIGAPRKDAPLTRLVVDAAWSSLPEFLTKTPWAETPSQTLAELNAVYEFTSMLASKPSRTELRARLDTFAPFFSEEPIVQGSSAMIALRYKAVSMFTPDANPIDNMITSLFLKDSAQTIEAAPISSFIGSLVKEFGISVDEAGNAIQNWINKNAEFIVADRTAVAARNLGSIINIYNTHPKYLFQLGNIESYIDLQRVVSLLSLYTNNDVAALRVTGPAVEAPPPPPVAAPVPEEALPEAELDEWLAYEQQMMGEMGEADEGAPAEPDAAAAAVPFAEVPIAVPLPLAEGEVIPPIGDQWYLTRLKARDLELFEIKKSDNPRVKQYSRACGKTADRQPHGMAPETYARARALYGNDVFWVELPMSHDDLAAAQIVAKAPAERDKVEKSVKKLLAMEKRALMLGFPLKGDQSVVSLKKYEKSKEISIEDRTDIATLLEQQQQKPLWIVVRAGSSDAKTNYYMCGEYWCVRDDLPIIPKEFQGTKYRDGRVKAPNSCPFCGGALIMNTDAPRVGETVIQRQSKPTLAPYAGIQEIYHPDGFALPCCFVAPKDLEVPAGAKGFPAPKVPLPPLQVEETAAAVAVAEEAPVPEPPVPAESALPADRESRDRPFSAKRGPSASNRWYLPNQNVLGRFNEEWFAIEQGAISVPPKPVSKLLGQDPEKFLTAVKGVRAVGQNSYLAPIGAGFVRYGLAGNSKEPGLMFLGFVAFAKYASMYLQTGDDSLMINTPQEILNDLLGAKERLLRNAFPQANYGTLLHEFATPGYDLPAERLTEFQAWWGSTGRTTQPHQRAYAVNQFLAYENFKNYLRQPKEYKELRHFETLFATPGLFSQTGFVVVRIVYKRNKETAIVCPSFGVSIKDQEQKPPILFVLEDEASGSYEPLVFYEGNGTNKYLFGMISTEKPQFLSLSVPIREALSAFIAQYFGTSAGCGRSAAPVHPWMPVRDSSRVPTLGAFNAVVRESSDLSAVVALIRDRSNRLVGVITTFKSRDYFIPVVDDGTVVLEAQVLFGEDAIPRPQLSVILEMLTGKQNVISEKKIVRQFPSLMPKKLLATSENFIALELECGAIIPFEPFSLTSDVQHRRFAELRKSVVTVDIVDANPWDIDVSLLRQAKPDDPTISTTADEFLNEAYQHLRISFSNFIHTAEGERVRQQIELLRQAKRRLPLFELQKRLDILLTSIIANPTNPWMSAEGNPTMSMMRRDCLAITSESKCTGGCTWSSGRCLIHTTQTERYIDPIRTCIARLTDELLRSFGAADEILNQHVPYLRAMDRSSIQRTDDSLLFSVSGRGTEQLYARLGYGQREPTEYTRGLTYPEEVEILPEDVIPEEGLNPDWATTLQIAKFAAPIQRDTRARLAASLVSITGASIDAIEERLRAQFTGKAEQWESIGHAFKFNVIQTKLDPVTKVPVPENVMYAVAGAAGVIMDLDFVILDPMGIPIQQKGTLKQKLKRSELPTSLQMWIAS